METKDFITSRKEVYTRLLCDLIKANTVNPPGDEHVAAKIIKKRLGKIKVKYKIHEKKKHRSNIIAKVGDEKGRKILISTHLDTVPPGDGWDTDPFKATIKDSIVYGRGACDNKGQATAALLVLEWLKCMEQKLKNQYIFVFAADEEAGSTLGIRCLLAEGIIAPDMAIVVDVGGAMQKVTVAEKGVLRVKMAAKGKQAHGSQPHRGVSAIAAMSKMIAKLDHYILKHELHKYLTRPTINFGTIKGGTAPNIVAGSCECVLDIRYLPSQVPKDIIAELKEISQRFGEFEFDIMTNLPPTEIDDKSPLVQSILGITKNHGISAKVKGLSGATDTKAFVLKDIPAVGFDFADDNVAHTANEYCRLDNLFLFCEVLIDVCLELNR